MPAPFPSEDFEIIVGITGYLHVKCLKCNLYVTVEYRGLDGMMPEIRVECPQCENGRAFLIYNTDCLGFHREPAPR